MSNSAADYIEGDVFHSRRVNDLKNNYAGATAPTTPATGARWFDTTISKLKYWNGSAWIHVTTAIWQFPIGAIIAWAGGYFTNGSNAGYTYVLGSANTVAGANAYLNALGWYVCNGSAVDIAASPIWNAANRYLPNLTDSRFLCGSTAAGTVGGSNTMAHTHDIDFASTSSSGSSAGAGNPLFLAGSAITGSDTHTHPVNPAPATSSAASDEENRPTFLSAFYIVRVF